MRPAINTGHLFRPLDDKLMDLLLQLKDEDWNRPTVAGTWCVKDVAGHLLDGNIRALSMQRDRYFGEKTPNITGYDDLVAWLNQLNADWVKAMKRISPKVMIMLHEATGAQTSKYFASLDPMAEAVFSVDWAGETKSYNWMHVAREYTEKWHHQQQIRDVLGIEGIMTEQFYPPFIGTYLLGLPHAFRDTKAPIGTTVRLEVSTTLGGVWFLTRNDDQWTLSAEAQAPVSSSVILHPDIAWKLFSKNLRPHQVTDQVVIEGDTLLAEQVLNMVSVMA